MKKMKKSGKIVLFSLEVYEGVFRDVKISKNLVECEFQSSFAVRCYSRYRKVVIARKTIKSSTIEGFKPFRWNSQCEICGFNAKNNRGLRIHETKCHEIDVERKKPEIDVECKRPEIVEIKDFKIRPQKKLSLGKIAKTLETTKKIENRSIREVYRERMKNQYLREAESIV